MKKIIKPFLIVCILAIIIGAVFMYFRKKDIDYELEEVEDYSYYPVLQNGKYGILDLNGNILVTPQYKQVIIPNPAKDVFVCYSEDGSKKIFNSKQEELFKNYEKVDEIKYAGTISNMPYEKSVLSYKEGDKYGLIDFNGKKITKPLYEEILSVPYKEGEILAKKNGKYGVINNKGVTLIDFDYDEIKGDGFYNDETKYKEAGYIIANKTVEGYRYGYINKKLEKVLNTEYNDIYRIVFKDDSQKVYLIIKKNGQNGVVYNKNTIIECKYQNIEYNEEKKTFTVEKDSKYGVFDLNGTKIVPVEYDYITYLGNYICANQNELIKYFDEFGKESVDIEYISVKDIENSNYSITVSENNLYGIIDGKQKVLVQNSYDYIDYLFGDYFVALRDSKLGIIDSKNNVLVEFKYDVLQKVGDTNIVQGKISSINVTDMYSKNLQKVATVENAILKQYKDYIEVYSNNNTLYFDFDGNEKKNVQILKENTLFAIEQNGKWGFADKNGKIVVECIYDKVTELNKYGFAGIMLTGKWGVINKEGQVILQPIYEHFKENEKPDFIGRYFRVSYGYGEAYYTDRELQ